MPTWCVNKKTKSALMRASIAQAQGVKARSLPFQRKTSSPRIKIKEFSVFYWLCWLATESFRTFTREKRKSDKINKSRSNRNKCGKVFGKLGEIPMNSEWKFHAKVDGAKQFSRNIIFHVVSSRGISQTWRVPIQFPRFTSTTMWTRQQQWHRSEEFYVWKCLNLRLSCKRN